MLPLRLGYPIAYAMMRAPKRWRFALLMMVILPFWTSFLIRVYAWIGILKKEGLLNLALLNLGVIDQPLTILNTRSEEHTSELQSLMRLSYAVFFLKKKKNK